ncbi:GTPase ObgE [Marinoscillum sp. MHG1-6]|uniref:GTPase ObgE n=1 Tax=Marinoscillum sp. MHG1-6 TaxID=2959627 RepID=UPI00215783DF|nr:GTPase ObgE [Marinoscillum sp. MHG1-6]
MESNFIDHVKFYARSGDGGAGSVHFRREKFVPKGGPDGGDGGRGGHIILKGNAQLWTLLHMRYKRHVKADHGVAGEGGNRFGANGADIVLEVPLGTVAKDAETGEVVLEILEDGEEKILLEGGMGGLGNSHFKTPTNQAPRYAQPGIEGVEKWVVLELKILADVGLVGFPNAGKSTLLSVVSAAKPEIADYPFTTLVPNLGVVPYRDYKSFVIADIPGIIEGAAEGRGLGLRFLRHIERNSMLLFMIPADAEDIQVEYNILVGELEKYNPELLDKQRLLAITKCDMLDEELIEEMKAELPEIETLFISSISGLGIQQLKDKIWVSLNG